MKVDADTWTLLFFQAVEFVLVAAIAEHFGLDNAVGFRRAGLTWAPLQATRVWNTKKTSSR